MWSSCLKSECEIQLPLIIIKLKFSRSYSEVTGPEGQREKLLPKLEDFKPSKSVKNLGVIFDSELTFIPHIKNITKIGFYHVKNIARVHPFLSQASTEVLMHAFISCHLDYCNALLSGLPKKSMHNLQLPYYTCFKIAALTM